MTEFELKDGRGFAAIPGTGVLTFEIQGISERDEIREKEFQSLYSKYITDQATMRLDDYTVPLWGDGHNLYPQQVFSTTSENKLLPEVIQKQVKFLFGKGPRLYQEVVRGEGEKQRRVRIPIENKEIQDWLESWEESGFDGVWAYLKNLITDYYYVNTCITQYEFSRTRRLSPSLSGKVGAGLPVIALSYIGSDEARLATKKDSLTKRITNKDCDYVITGDWMNPNRFDYNVYHRFNPAEPFRYPAAIAFNSDKTFTKSIYALNNWFHGLYEWIKASNLSPKYLNSYLKNALNAHIHVIIPGSWYNKQKETLQTICIENMTGDLPVQTEYKGVKLIDEKGKTIQFYETMVDQLISNELRAISNMMSGEGKNQGKMWASTRWAQDDGWELKEFPGKFKEYFVLKEINRAIHLNFPEAQKQGIRLGFWIGIPAKLQDTTSADRPAQTATADPKSNIQKTEEQQ